MVLKECVLSLRLNLVPRSLYRAVCREMLIGIVIAMCSPRDPPRHFGNRFPDLSPKWEYLLLRAAQLVSKWDFVSYATDKTSKRSITKAD